jgi:SPP1 family phage portal protein
VEKRYDLCGRKVIYTDVEEITPDNVLKVLEKAMETHNTNSSDIDYLYRYYKGEQPILSRVKEVRPEINNKVAVNRANEIITFKLGYTFADPIQYVCRKEDDDSSEDINTLNEYMYCEDKAEKDTELAMWMYIGGVGCRLTLPKKNFEIDESPFELYTLDPRYAFTVYHNGLGNKRKMGVKYIKLDDNKVLYSVYTDKLYFEILDDKIVSVQEHYMGTVPIVEYPANTARLGAFEVVLPLLDAINTVASNRLDGVEQFIQALLVLKGVDIESEEFKSLREAGGLKLPLDGVAEYLTAELNQTQTQTLVDDMYDTVLTICGMPNRNGGSSTSDTGTAVIVRDGWSDAEARAKEVERIFKRSEKETLRIAIGLMNDLKDMSLKLSSVDIRFTRRNYENIQMKVQVLTTMLNNDSIHPRLAFEHCGLFIDPELAYTVSMEYKEQRAAEMLKELEEEIPIEEESAEETEEIKGEDEDV